MSVVTWQRYVTTLCADVWQLDAHATNDVIARIEALDSDDRLTDWAVAGVLRGVGVSGRSVDVIAVTIRVAVHA